MLVTGATGYIGERLVQPLIKAGHRVRVLVHSRSRAIARSWHAQVEATVGDVLDPQSLSAALAGIDASPTTCASATRWIFGGSRICYVTDWFACDRR